MKSIKQLRQQIDKIDEAVLKKLSQRNRISLKIGKLKATQGKNVLDKKREHALFARYELLSSQYDLDANFVKKLFKMIISHSRKLQK